MSAHNDGKTPTTDEAKKLAEAAFEKAKTANAAEAKPEPAKAAKEVAPKKEEAKPAAKAAPAKAAAEKPKEDRNEAFLVGEVMRAATKQMRQATQTWTAMNQQRQGELLRCLADDVRDSCRALASAIASNQRLTFSAGVDSVAFKGKGDVRVTLKLNATQDAHSLADVAGKTITVVIEDVSKLLALDEKDVKGEPDNRPLFDASTDPKVTGRSAAA